MADHDRERHEPLLIASADELLRLSTRRQFIRKLGVGGSIVLLPSVFTACDDDDDPTGNGNGQGGTLTSLAFDLRTDVGIFRLTQSLEIIEGYFYTRVVTKSDFTTMFTAEEQEILIDIRNAEVLHREVLRAGLGAQAVPDFTGSLNTATLTQILSSKASILATARMFETTGVATLNGAGKFIKDARNLLFAGKLASAEARHRAALRDVSVNNTTAFAGDDSIDANGRDVKIEAPDTLARLKATNIVAEPLNSNITISNLPDASQGTVNVTPDLFPANP
jgi:hypothetical protein